MRPLSGQLHYCAVIWKPSMASPPASKACGSPLIACVCAGSGLAINCHAVRRLGGKQKGAQTGPLWPHSDGVVDAGRNHHHRDPAAVPSLWACRRADPSADTGNRNKRILHGALNVNSGELLLLITEEWTADTHRLFLQMIRSHWRGWHIVLVEDRGA